MGEILEFPSPQSRGMAFLERELRRLLASKGADEELIEFATAQLARSYRRVSDSEQYRFSVTLPDGLDAAQRDALESEINAGLEGLRRENHALILELVAQLLLTQVRLFQHERPDG